MDRSRAVEKAAAMMNAPDDKEDGGQEDNAAKIWENSNINIQLLVFMRIGPSKR